MKSLYKAVRAVPAVFKQEHDGVTADKVAVLQPIFAVIVGAAPIVVADVPASPGTPTHE